ncbi:MAG: hypothetical protein DRP56_07590 [Planctomycetota bacterium]|nr:MAG: hypothetical protein DRP56_07590 [Planctomycetota bacterium]
MGHELEIRNGEASMFYTGKGRVYLGTLDNTREITWDQPATREFIGRLIKYALLRDVFREQKREQLGRKRKK